MTWHVKSTDCKDIENSDNDMRHLEWGNHREQSVKHEVWQQWHLYIWVRVQRAALLVVVHKENHRTGQNFLQHGERKGKVESSAKGEVLFVI